MANHLSLWTCPVQAVTEVSSGRRFESARDYFCDERPREARASPSESREADEGIPVTAVRIRTERFVSAVEGRVIAAATALSVRGRISQTTRSTVVATATSNGT